MESLRHTVCPNEDIAFLDGSCFNIIVLNTCGHYNSIHFLEIRIAFIGVTLALLSSLQVWCLECTERAHEEIRVHRRNLENCCQAIQSSFVNWEQKVAAPDCELTFLVLS